MKKIKIIFILSLSVILMMNVRAQETYKLTGKVVSTSNTPIEKVLISIQDTLNVNTNEFGLFSVELKEPLQTISVWTPGYYPVKQLINNRTEFFFILVPENQYKYNESIVLPFRGVDTKKEDYTSATNISRKDVPLGRVKIDQALDGQVAGLKIKRNSGMPGEGSYYNLRGIRSLSGDNAPLIVVNGVPYMPDKNSSLLFNGYTRDVFQTYNIGDVRNITVLKGSEASMYGSLGSNGVILVETNVVASSNLDTKITYEGTFGINWNNKRMSLLEGNDYKSYLSDVGMTYFSDMDNFFINFPFLNDPDNENYNHFYNNTTDWQDIIYQNAFTTTNLFRVEGGDQIAKYDLSIGYVTDGGMVEATSHNRFHTQLNTNILVNKKVNIFANIGLAYLNTKLQDQGINSGTNPILAAYAKSPVLSPYNKESDGSVLSTYSSYYFGNSNVMDFAVSNPLAMINTIDARSRQYDVNIQVGLNYVPTTNLKLTGIIALYHNYNTEHLFIPGLTDETIIPLIDGYGAAYNTAKEGVAETLNMYGNVNGCYIKTFDYVHRLNVIAGAQLMTTKNEYDVAVGRNTTNDFYQYLGTTQSIGRYFYGYLNKWNWMNFYTHADYTYNNMVQASVNMAIDGASSTGVDVSHFSIYPSFGLTGLGKGWKPFMNSTWINKLNFRAEYGITGNTRFASSMGQYYYTSAPYEGISSIVRSNVPNTRLKPEKIGSLNLGLDFSAYFNRFHLSFDYFNNQISDMICSMPLSSVYGTAPYYTNIGEMKNQGVELAFQLAVVRLRDVEWILGGNISKYNSKIISLGGNEQIIMSYEDGAQLITKVGESPYQFYGYEVLGVFSTIAEAESADLVNRTGIKYTAGDMHFKDQNDDNKIDDNDRVALDSASPDFFGGFYTQFKYKNFAIAAEFSYSKGNMAYNATRRALESMSTTGNQSSAVLNRWTIEGQVTNIPKAEYGDKVGNSVFSERWIEDASYLKMKNITFSCSFDKPILNFFHSGTLFVTAENLFTATKYLGLDPEFSYSFRDDLQGFDYAKVMQPKTIKFGINLNL